MVNTRKNQPQNTAGILRKKHSIFILVTVIFSLLELQSGQILITCQGCRAVTPITPLRNRKPP